MTWANPLNAERLQGVAGVTTRKNAGRKRDKVSGSIGWRTGVASTRRTLPVLSSLEGSIQNSVPEGALARSPGKTRLLSTTFGFSPKAPKTMET
jgi:hypothetical protein